jgi:stage V sporulation protein R
MGYFWPQMETKIINEEAGPTYWHARIMRELDLNSRGKHSSCPPARQRHPAGPNAEQPYYIGRKIFEDIESALG